METALTVSRSFWSDHNVPGSVTDCGWRGCWAWRSVGRSRSRRNVRIFWFLEHSMGGAGDGGEKNSEELRKGSSV
jgi:hypothetical protein